MGWKDFLNFIRNSLVAPSKDQSVILVMAVMAFVVINFYVVYYLLNSHFVIITGHSNNLLNLNNKFYVRIIIALLFIDYNSILLQKKPD